MWRKRRCTQVLMMSLSWYVLKSGLAYVVDVTAFALAKAGEELGYLAEKIDPDQ